METPPTAPHVRPQGEDMWPTDLWQQFNRRFCLLARFVASPLTRSRTSNMLGTVRCVALQLASKRRRELCVCGPHRGRRGTKSRSASLETVRHSHLWGARKPSRATVEDSTAGSDQTLRAGRPLVGGVIPLFTSRGGARIPCHTGCQEEFNTPECMRPPRPLQACVCSWGSAKYL